jgi:hypothetical protein
VSEHREERGLPIGLGFHLGQQLRGFGGDLAAGVLGSGAPCGPAEAHHLVKVA